MFIQLKKHSPKLLYVLSITLFTFCMLGFLLQYFGQAINVKAFFLINAIGSTHDTFWSVVTYLGDGRFAAVLLILLFFRDSHMLLASVASAILVRLTAQGGKALFGVLRPENTTIASDANFIGPALAPENFAFPSGHSATIAMCAVLIIVGRTGLNHALKVALFALTFFIATSRVIVGAHWPADVFVGFAAGGFIALFCSMLSTNSRILISVIYIVCILLSLNVVAGTKAFYSDITLIRAFEILFGTLAIAACIYGGLINIIRYKEKTESS